MKKKYWDLASGTFLLAFSVILFIGAQKVKTLAVSSIGSGFFPSVVAVLLAITSLAVIAGGVAQARKADAGGAAKDEDKPRTWGVLSTFGLMALYALLLPKVGFLITTTVYLFVQINILSPNGSRRQLMFGIISAVTSVVIYYTFVSVFHLMLPSGILG